jgi:hypothetical protein
MKNLLNLSFNRAVSGEYIQRLFGQHGMEKILEEVLRVLTECLCLQFVLQIVLS